MTLELPGLSERRWATLSRDGIYRYALGRSWDPTGPTAVFVMLNPSTADENEDDPTIRRCRSFAKREGCGTLVVVNLYAYRSTDPVILRLVQDPVGPDNDAELAAQISHPDAALIVAAWGTRPPGGPSNRQRRHVEEVALLAGRELVCLGHTADGSPRHPLYVRGDTPLERFAR